MQASAREEERSVPPDGTQNIRNGSPASAGVPAPARKPPNAEVWEAVRIACGINGSLTPTAAKLIGRTAKEIVAAGGSAADVPMRAAAYREKYPRAELTPEALRKHWPALDGQTRMDRLLEEWEA